MGPSAFYCQIYTGFFRTNMIDNSCVHIRKADKCSFTYFWSSIFHISKVFCHHVESIHVVCCCAVIRNLHMTVSVYKNIINLDVPVEKKKCQACSLDNYPPYTPILLIHRGINNHKAPFSITVYAQLDAIQDTVISFMN